ncbi:MAG: flagellar biosynthetic protein FliR [Planctomycetia bacterium]|nr:MAG: flagellar biosynthetic protein FliR [Planctomycetia bacterium]
MPVGLTELVSALPTFALVLARIGGFLMFQPLLGGESFPVNVRLLLVFALALVISPAVEAPSDPPESFAALAIGMGAEALLGALFAQLVMMCFIGLQLGGTLIAQESGLAFGSVVNPATAEEESVLSTFYVQLAMIVFLAAGGHRVIIGAALDSFASIPLLAVTNVLERGTPLLLDAVATGFSMGVRVAAPAILAMFLVNAGLGIVSRTMPQFNVVALGFSSKSVIAFGITAVTLPTAIDMFSQGVEQVSGWVDELLHTQAAAHWLAR